jgi:RecB family exonuclease
MMAFQQVCQHRWNLDYLQGKRGKNYGIHLDFGTSFHHAIEKFYTREDPCTLEEALKLFEDKFRELYGRHKEKYTQRERDANDPEEFVAAGRTIINSFKSCPDLNEFEVVYNEHKLELPIELKDDLSVKFKGFIDLVVKAKDGRGKTILYVIDFKTCSWGWGRDQRTDKQKHMQLFLYKHFFCKKFKLDPNQVRCGFVLLKRRPPKDTHPVEFFSVSAGPVSVQRALDEMGSIITEMSQRSVSGKFLKNRASCVNQFGQVCPHKGTELCPDDGAPLSK